MHLAILAASKTYCQGSRGTNDLSVAAVLSEIGISQARKSSSGEDEITLVTNASVWIYAIVGADGCGLYTNEPIVFDQI